MSVMVVVDVACDDERVTLTPATADETMRSRVRRVWDAELFQRDLVADGEPQITVQVGFFGAVTYRCSGSATPRHDIWLAEIGQEVPTS